MSENPYAAPQANLSIAPVAPGDGAMISPYGPYRDISFMQTAVLGLLGVLALLSLAQFVVLVQLNQANRLIDDDPSAPERIDQAVSLSSTIETGSSLVYLVTVIFWCIWKNWSCKNAWVFEYHRKGRDAINSSVITPGWSVGGYFIPIFNLYKPYQAMAFIRDSVSKQMLASRMLPFWWITWLLLFYVGTIFLFFIGKWRIHSEADLDLEDLLLYNQSLMIDAAFYLVSCLIAGTVIWQLSVGQKRTARELGVDAVGRL